MGQMSRFERFAADMLYVITSGGHLDTDVVKRFGEQLDEIYANPFEKRVPDKKMTAADIKDHVASKIKGLLQEMEG